MRGIGGGRLWKRGASAKKEGALSSSFAVFCSWRRFLELHNGSMLIKGAVLAGKGGGSDLKSCNFALFALFYGKVVGVRRRNARKTVAVMEENF